jgi:cell division protein FtsB
MTRIAIVLLVVLFAGLQYKLWLGDGGLLELWQLKQNVTEQKTANAVMEEQNAELTAEVEDLKIGVAAVEERARTELGMIKDDEVFYQIVDENTHVNYSNQ